jgi:hypothetical protein
MKTRNRREFLLGAGITLSSVAAYPHLWGEAPTFRATPKLAAEALPSGADESAPASGAPREAMRGLMVDAARVPESMDYYRRVIEFCADWELNTLQFRLCS